MTCLPCIWITAFALNVLNLGDHALNTVTLGDANETVSARVARARDAGQPWAATTCDYLTAAQTIVTLDQIRMDHCAYALDKSIKPNTSEILNLNVTPPVMRRKPVNQE